MSEALPFEHQPKKTRRRLPRSGCPLTRRPGKHGGAEIAMDRSMASSPLSPWCRRFDGVHGCEGLGKLDCCEDDWVLPTGAPGKGSIRVSRLAS